MNKIKLSKIKKKKRKQRCISSTYRRERERETKRERERQREKEANLFSKALLLVSRTLVVDLVDAFVDLLLLLRPAAEEHVVDEGVLQQRQEYEHEAAHEVDVDGFHVRDLGERLPKVGVDGRHGEHRSNTWSEGERDATPTK